MSALFSLPLASDPNALVRWEYITGQWDDQTYQGAVSSTMPDTALLGNGDVGVTSAGSAGVKTFLLGKGDFWAGNPSPKPAPVGGVTTMAASSVVAAAFRVRLVDGGGLEIRPQSYQAQGRLS